MFIGGIYNIDDDSLKITPNKTSWDLATWNNLNIDSPYKDNICNITIECVAGDVLQCHVTYAYKEDGDDQWKTWTETYGLKDFSLSLQSKHRIAYSDEVSPGYEGKRNKILGIENTPTLLNWQSILNVNN